MKKSTFVGMKFGTFMGIIWAVALSALLGPIAIGFGVAIGASFFCFGIAVYRDLDTKINPAENDHK